MNWHDLSEHTSTLVALLGLVATVAGVLFYRLINGMDKKIDKATSCLLEIIKGCGERRLQCGDDFVGKPEFKEWKEGRDGKGGLWDTLNHHAHDLKGRVTRT